MHRTHRHALALLLLAMLLAVFVVGLARSAAGERTPGLLPDAANGRRIAETLCSSCHLVGASQSGGSAIAGVPSFKAIANHTGQTPERLAGAIIIPHPPMPAIALTNVEMRDVIAYILTLRTD